MSDNEKKILARLAPLLKKACEEGLWFNCKYHFNYLWLSPDELEDANSKGKFLWEADN